MSSPVKGQYKEICGDYGVLLTDGDGRNGAETCDAVNDCQAGTEVTCQQTGVQCVASICDETAEGCIDAPTDEGEPCDDGSACTVDNTCASGECVGEPLCNEPCEICGEGATCTDRCAHPFTDRSEANVLDGLFVLRGAVGLETCYLCWCDVNSTMNVTAVDSLIIARNAVGLISSMECPDMPHPPPTTTLPGVTTTTTADSTTTTSLQ